MSTRRSLTRLHQQISDELSRRIGSVQRELQSVYRDVREEVQDEIAKMHERYAVQGELRRAEMTKYNRLTNLEKRLNKIAGRGSQKARARLTRLRETQFNAAFFRYAWAIEQHTGIQISWGMFSEDAVKAAIESDLYNRAVQELTRQNARRINRTVAESITRGSSFSRMSRDIRRQVGNTRRDADRIARTEGARAQSIGQRKLHEQARDKGIDGNRVWIATLDDRTRVTPPDKYDHGRLDGKEADPEKGFWIEQLGCYIPGPHESGEPAFDINCRCDVRYEVEELAPELRRIRDEEGLQPYVTFDEWYGERVEE